MISRVLWRLGVVGAGLWAAFWLSLLTIFGAAADTAVVFGITVVGALAFLITCGGLSWAFKPLEGKR